jgi:hypothetical protein
MGSEDNDFIFVIVVIVLEVIEIQIHTLNPWSIELCLVRRISFELVGKVNLLLLSWV